MSQTICHSKSQPYWRAKDFEPHHMTRKDLESMVIPRQWNNTRNEPRKRTPGRRKRVAKRQDN